jgi:hypothetical protein
MNVKGYVAACTLFLGLMLGSCSPFSGLVADHWPHFAGGEPDGLPPRPGTPGYAAFIAHGQPSEPQDAATGGLPQNIPAGTAAPVERTPPVQTTAATGHMPPPAPPAAQAEEREPPAPDANALRGGLY